MYFADMKQAFAPVFDATGYSHPGDVPGLDTLRMAGRVIWQRLRPASATAGRGAGEAKTCTRGLLRRAGPESGIQRSPNFCIASKRKYHINS